MLVKILGILDVFIAIMFWIFGIFNLYFFGGFILLLGFILLVKGVVFALGGSVASVLDILCAIFIIVSASIILPKIVVIIISLYLLQKGVFSLMG